MRNIWKISDNHALVEGAKRCTVYCFNTGIVASISSEYAEHLRKYVIWISLSLTKSDHNSQTAQNRPITAKKFLIVPISAHCLWYNISKE